MRRFLYISPYFPPQTRVGALRPLKFARHLPRHGWAPVVLADLRPDDDMDRGLEALVPETTVVVRDYGPRARATERRYLAGELPPPELDGAGKPRVEGAKSRLGGSLWGRIESRLPDVLTPSPEFIPLGRHSVDMPHALKACRRILARGGLEAIIVNADPYAALLVGARAARQSRLPLVLDLRDPWSVCDLRRPMRRLPQRALNDRLERRAVRAASKVILNTQTALDAYREHYGDIPADRFAVIRNHGDAELVAAGEFTTPEVFTMLFLGRFRRFVEGTQLLLSLAELKRRGHDGSSVRLMYTGRGWKDTEQRAAELGVRDMLVDHPFVPYRRIGGFMETADLLVSLSHQTVQRIPAKIYDYAASERPILAITDNPEIGRLAERIGGMTVCPLGDVPAIADAMERELSLGRRRTIDRRETGLDSATAAMRLAGILDEVTSKHGR
jgi:hypothetical protein